MSLTGDQYELLSTAFRTAFTVQSLQRMLMFRLSKELYDYSSPFNDRQQVVFDLIQAADMEGWALRLIQAARDSNPGNSQLQVLAQTIGTTPANLPPPHELEAMVTSISLLDIAAWRAGLGEAEVRTGMVELRDAPKGTCFLLGPDIVMTNYHVVEGIFKNTATPADVTVRFDFKKLADGSTISSGTVYKLVAGDGWLVDCSPYSDLDVRPSPTEGVLPSETELDYALLRLDGKPGNLPVNSVKADPSGGEKPRGWLQIKTAPHPFAPDSPLYIVQHPLGQPLKLALDPRSVIKLNDPTARTRVRHRTNTDHGSSGSPCFDQDWKLVALHHSGDPSRITPTWNEAIPFDTIFRLLSQRGKAGELNQPLPV